MSSEPSDESLCVFDLILWFFFSQRVSLLLSYSLLSASFDGVCRAIWLLVPFSSIILISIGSYLFALSLSHHLE